MLKKLGIVLTLTLLNCSLLVGQEWPDFRGPTSNGISVAKGTPVSWSEQENVAWRSDIPGKGWSTPVVADGLIWLTTAVEDLATRDEQKEILAKLGADPKKFRQQHIAKSVTLNLLAIDLAKGTVQKNLELIKLDQPEPIHTLNSYASPTPFIDGDRIYCHFGTYGTICLNRKSGAEIWRRQISVVHSVGPGSSPFVHKDKLILICDGVEKQYVLALNKLTGETVWKTPRPPMDAPSGEQKKAYDTPVVARDASGREQLICMGSQWLVSYKPEDGSEIWKVYHGKGFSVVPRPVVDGDVVFISTGFGKPQLWAVRIDGQGDVTDSHVEWVEPKGIPAKPSPLVYDGRVYVISDDGIASCFNSTDGTMLWKQRIGGKFSASPLYADGKIYLCSQEGVVTVFKPGADYEMLAQNQIEGQLMASPVAIENFMLIRSDRALYRIED